MGSFKQLKSSDVITVPVIANKTWNFNYCPLPSTDPYISVYNGTNYTNSFNPETDPSTNTHYDRLTYRQINQLFYHQYSGSLNTASLASSIHYLSASSQHPSASFFNFNNDPAFISNFPTGANETIRVIQISPDAYGNKVLPYSFQMSSSQYNFYDDGKGNIYDNFSGTASVFVGNIFYPEGTVVITSQTYQNVFVLPAVAYDDVYDIIRNDYPNPATFSFYPLLNDDLRGNTLVNNSIHIFGGNASFFSTGSNNSVSLSFSGLGVGTYQTFYTFFTTGSYCYPLMSSTASITINVTDPECEFEIGIIIPPPYPPTPSVTPSSTPGITVTPSISISPTISISPSKTPSVTPTATISITPSLTPTSSPPTLYEFRPAEGCCSGDNQVISIPAAYGGGWYVTTTGQCYSVGDDSISGPATITWDGGTLYAGCAACEAANPCPTPTPTPTISISRTPTPTISLSATPSVTPTISISRTPSITPTISISKTPSITPTISISATPSITPTLTPTLSVTPSPTATFPACAVTLNSVGRNFGTTWQYNITTGTSCNFVYAEYSNDGVNYSNAGVGCGIVPIIDIGGISGTLYFRVTMLCNLGGPAVSNVIVVNNVSATPSPTISLTPTPTPTISITSTPSISITPTISVTPTISISRTPTVTPTISISATPSVTPTTSISRTPTVTPTISISATPSITPSTSGPACEIIAFNFGASKVGACSEFADFADFGLLGGDFLCSSGMTLLNSDGVSCLGVASAIHVADLGGGTGAQVRHWNGTSFGACSTCV